MEKQKTTLYENEIKLKSMTFEKKTKIIIIDFVVE